jgi:exodeoxyribonuclease VII large subunit
MAARRKIPDPTQQLSLSDGLLLQSALHNDTPNGEGINAIWSVAEALQLLTNAIDTHPMLGHDLTIKGELSNVRPASSGHIYATLKESTQGKVASLNMVLWRSTAQKLKFRPEDGLAVLATGRLNVYAPGGSVSLVVSHLVPEGVGALQLAYDQLKARLSEEGLFDEDRKRPLPVFTQRIGIVTSATGAVIHDMWRIIQQKNPQLQVIMAPVAVQGEGAAIQIANAIAALNNPALQLDALIIARGGGSFEDLFCFSEEPVVRAIVASRLPVVTGIGHQPDFGLADAAADYSAATPTAAADLLTPDIASWQHWVAERASLLNQEVTRQYHTDVQRVDYLVDKLAETTRYQLDTAGQTLNGLKTQLLQSIQQHQQWAEQQVAHLGDSLHQLSPLATLGRGYALVTNSQKHLITHTHQATTGDILTLNVSDGNIWVTVTNKL